MSEYKNIIDTDLPACSCNYGTPYDSLVSECEYGVKLDAYLVSLRSRLKKQIEQNFAIGTLEFEYWLDFNANWELYDIVLESAKEQFTSYVTPEKEHGFMMAAKGILFGLQAYYKIYPDCIVEDIWKFIDMYIEKQHNDIREWCDIGSEMWNDLPDENLIP